MVEEPGEEPKLYRQDTGELVTNISFVDPLLRGENNEYPEDLPKEKEHAKYPSSNKSKLYKDIDELLENLKKEDSVLKTKSDPNDKSSKTSKTFSSRRNSIHYSSSHRDKYEKKDKRYSYNPREDIDLLITDLSPDNGTAKTNEEKNILFVERKHKLHTLEKETRNSSEKMKEEAKKKDYSSSNHSGHKSTPTTESESKFETSPSKSKLSSNGKSILIKKNKNADLIDEILGLNNSSDVKMHANRKSEHSASEYRPRSVSTKTSSRKLRQHRVS